MLGTFQQKSLADMSKGNDVREDTYDIRSWMALMPGRTVHSKHGIFGKSTGIWKYQQRIVGRSWTSSQEMVVVWTYVEWWRKKQEESRHFWDVKLTRSAGVLVEGVKERGSRGYTA